MLLAAVQTDVQLADLTANERVVMQSLETCSRQSVDLAVFPECMLTGYGFESRQEAWQYGLPLSDGIFGRLAQAAGDLRLSLTIGFLLREGDRLFNAAALIDRRGVLGHYRKIHLPGLGVDRFVDRGDLAYTTHQLPLPRQDGTVRVGMAICYDCSFPEPMRVLALAGADVIALGTNWPVAAARTAEIVPAARSMENHLFFVAANRIGTERGFTFCGRSIICGPDGVVLAQSTDDQPTILVAHADPAAARNKRIERTIGKHVIDRFADRRPEHYGPVADPGA